MDSAEKKQRSLRRALWLVNLGSLGAVAYILLVGGNYLHARDLAERSRASVQREQQESELTAREWHALRLDGKPFAVIDTRPRKEFAPKHLLAAINIPGNELAARAKWEVPRDRTIVVACGHNATCYGKYTEALIQTPCARSRQELLRLGFRDVKILAASEDELFAQGELLGSDNFDLRLASLNLDL